MNNSLEIGQESGPAVEEKEGLPLFPGKSLLTWLDSVGIQDLNIIDQLL